MDPTRPVSSANHPDQIAPLRPHQRLACDFALDHPKCGLYLPLGYGKSLTTLEALYELNPKGHVLVIGPKSVMQSTWVDEIEKWGYPFRTKSLIADERGRKLTAKARHERYRQVFSDAPSIYYINRELVSDLVAHMPTRTQDKRELIVWPFSIVVIDEAQSFKGYASARFRALAKVAGACERIIELTGTPSPNGVQDLWALVYLLDGGKRLGRNITEFRDRYCIAYNLPNSKGRIYKIRPGADVAVQNLIADITLSVKDKGIEASLPPVTMDMRKIELSENEHELYRRLERDAVIEFSDETSVVGANSAVLQAKLSQLASGTLYVTDDDGLAQDMDGEADVVDISRLAVSAVAHRRYVVVHTRKIDELMRIVEDAGSCVLVAYRFQSEAAEIERELTEAHVDVRRFDGSRDMVDEWNSRKIQVMLIHPASAGAGLNLQKGGHTLVWYSVPWNLEHYLQTNKRIDRPGQTEPVMIHHLLADCGVERDVMDAIGRKQRVEDAVLAAVRRDVPDMQDEIDTAKERRRSYEDAHTDTLPVATAAQATPSAG